MADISVIKTPDGSSYNLKDSSARSDIVELETLYNGLDVIYAKKTAVGAPLIANTVSDMTDATRPYVYTGSESGYFNGHWYYYDSSSWVDGGVYNSVAVETDKNLSSEGVAADAKAVGDKINSIQDIQDCAFLDLVQTPTLAQGSISSSTGEVTSTNKTRRLRTPYYLHVPNGFKMSIPEGFRVFLHFYSSETYEAYVGNSESWLEGDLTLSKPMAAYMKFVVSRINDGTLTPEDLSSSPINLKPVSFTDKSLSIQDKAADAKVTGEKLADKIGFVQTIDSNNDLNSLSLNGVYSWKNDSVPSNSPTMGSAVLLQYGGDETRSQIIINSVGEMYIRYKGASSWSSWRQMQSTLVTL